MKNAAPRPGYVPRRKCREGKFDPVPSNAGKKFSRLCRRTDRHQGSDRLKMKKIASASEAIMLGNRSGIYAPEELLLFRRIFENAVGSLPAVMRTSENRSRIARNILESVRLLANVTRLLADRTVDGITAHVERAREYAESSPSVVTPLNRYIGYEEAAKVAKRALAERKTIRETVIEGGYVERGLLSETQLDEALDVLGMTHP